MTYASGRLVCLQCATQNARSERFGTNLKAIIVGLLVLAGAALIVVLWPGASSPPPKPEPPDLGFDYGDYSAAVERQRERLAREPCDRTMIIKHAETLFRAGDYRGVTNRANQFFTACGEYPYLRWNTYAAHKRLSEFDEAIADATILIADDPDDVDFWWWRAQTYEQRGKFAEAASDYQQMLRIDPELDSTALDLARVLERLGRHCEALAAVEQAIYADPDLDLDSRINHRMTRLREQGKCDESAPPAPAPPAD